MYLAHFNLHENPFSITPDPRFVFLTGRHREALAHLLYGLAEGGGFVQLTGEVGTGKTTICRTLLRQLPEHVDVALIFNPQLSVLELLGSICTELRIERPAQSESIKTLVDRLYEHLLDANARGRRTVLILDEAQNLTAELLEEVRLLTNLETDDTKLLQVFLIGQPELRVKLASVHLRQLAQRITARYHLQCLSADETRLYIRHRLSVAGCAREIFSRAAVRNVHRLSEGIPRRINILCDRALLGAYATDAQRVSGSIVRQANAEIRGEEHSRARTIGRYAALLLIAVGALALGALTLKPHDLGFPNWLDQGAAMVGIASVSGNSPASPARAPALPDPLAVPASDAITAIPEPGPAALASSESRTTAGEAEGLGLIDTDAAMDAERSQVTTANASAAATEFAAPSSLPPELAPPQPLPQREPVAPPSPPAPSVEELIAAAEGDGWSEAVNALARVWGLLSPPADADFCTWARGEGLMCYSQSASLAQLRGFDLPAVLRIHGPQGAGVHALLLKLSENDATIELAGRVQRIAQAELERLWRGEFVLLWRAPLASVQSIQLGHTGRRVEWLNDTLASIDGRKLPSRTSANFDSALLQRVKDFQRQRDLMVDGIVGPQSFIHLAQHVAGQGTPRLSTSAAATVAAPAASISLGVR